MWPAAPACRLIAALVPAVLLAAASIASSLLPAHPLRGISPQDEKYYSGAVIACRDGSSSFQRDRLNDDFCDCPDGTDEPGTSACPESKFYCRNVGDVPRFLFSSRVNDHICDCCDGTDEYDGGIICPNTCQKDVSVLLNMSDVGISNDIKVNFVDALERRNRVDLEDLLQKLKGLKVVIIMELAAIIWIVTFCIRRRQSRKRHLLGGAR